jgi:two-component system cell cycle sensor histidine kinase/response regulator CckA
MQETILVLDDDEWIREVASIGLEREGFRVISAGTGEEAVELAGTPAQKLIHLLLADVVLPGISGPDAAIRIQKLWPNIRVLFMSGYGEDVLSQYGIGEKRTGFLQKPFTPAALLAKVRRLLDQPFVDAARRAIRKEQAAEPRSQRVA